MPFDEIHALQKDVAALGEVGVPSMPGVPSMSGVPSMPDVTGMADIPAAGMPGVDFGVGDLFDDLEDKKPAFKGFLNWV